MMPALVDRRQWLGAAASLSIAARTEDGDLCAPARTTTPATGGDEPQNVEPIAEWLLSAAEATLVPDLRARLADDWKMGDVFAALLLVSAHRSDSIQGGGGFHTVLEVDALRFFAYESRGRRAFLQDPARRAPSNESDCTQAWHPHLLAMMRLYGPSASTELCRAWQLVVGAP